MINALETPSTRPYLIRALYEWCTDNGFTPYVAVAVDDSVVVPREYVRDGEIVLNISFDATSALRLGNEAIEFKARFAGVARDICVPIHRVIAIYARENGQGMAFPLLAQDMGAEGGAKGSAKSTGRVTPALSSVKESSAAAKPVPVVPVVPTQDTASPQDDGDTDPPIPPRPSGGAGRPQLKRIK